MLRGFIPAFVPSSHARQPRRPAGRHRPARVLLYYGLQGVSIPFLPLWFAERGLDSAFIGLIVATALLPKILSTPVVAHVADQTGRAHALIAAALIGSLLLYACYPLAATPAWLFAVTLLLNAVFPSVLPLLDRMAIASRRGQGNSYTLIRACGSLGFALMTVSGGYLIKTHGVNWVMWLPMLMIVACLAMLRLLPGRAARAGRRARASRPCAPCCATARCCCASPPPRWCRPATASCILFDAALDGPGPVHRADITIVGGGRGQRGAVLLRRAQVLARVGAAADPDLGRDDGDPMDRAGDHRRPHRHRRPAAAAVLHAGRQQRRHHVAHRRARAGHGQDLGDRAVRAAVGRVFMFASIQLGGALYRHYAPGGFLVMALCALGAVPLLRRARAGAGWRGLNRRGRRGQRPAVSVGRRPSSASGLSTSTHSLPVRVQWSRTRQ